MKRFNLATLTFTCALTSCSNPVIEKPDASASQGFGTVRVSLTQGAARTAMPAVPTGLTYTYTFTKNGGTPEDKTSDTGVFTLEAGSYTLTVKAYLAENGVEVVHIYANLDTVVAYTFTGNEFHKPPTTITSAADLITYLTTLPTGSAATPSTVALSLAFNTGTTWTKQ